MKKLLLAITALISYGYCFAQTSSNERIIEADFLKTKGKKNIAYQECIGAGRASEGLRADWQQQLALVKKEIGFKYIRFHGLLNDDMHIYTEDKTTKNPVYNFQYVDKLFDYLLSIDVKPFVEFGFMPPELASGTKTVFWWKGNITPPKSYERWSDLIKALVKHFEERYGKTEVEKWYFEVWNEPDLGGFFTGDMNEYFKLYQTTALAVKSVSPNYRVGGPATSGCKWINETLKFCSDNKIPLDFVSTHSYNTKQALDEFGLKRPRLLEINYLSNNALSTRRKIDSTSYKGMELHFTEFNSSPSSRDAIHDTYQNAAYILHTLKRTEGAVSSMSYWTFTDIFEEAGPAVTPFHGGFGLLNLQGIKKPTFYTYKFMSQLGDIELENKDLSSWVCKDKKDIQVLFWDLKLPVDDEFNIKKFSKEVPSKNLEKVKVDLKHIPNGNYKVEIYQVGYKKNDPYSAYLGMGSPFNISLDQEVALKKIAEIAPISEKKVKITNERYTEDFKMRENDIYFVKLIRL
jgi:xylan 1,4-beta-xylosidase